tara:strand:- start:3157 stop:3888 length:732 start_codon:yes stop_codon:yes gene_type:complete
MKIGLAVGRDFSGKAEMIYNSLKVSGYKPDFILFCFPEPKRIMNYKKIKWLPRILIAFAIKVLPIFILKIISKKFQPNVDTKIYFVKSINSLKSRRILFLQNPDVVVVYSCGFIKKNICELFHNVFMNAHAGKLPEFRGVNNVEWTYLMGQELFGTIQFTAPLMDTGDIVYEEKMEKVRQPENIEQIRQDAFIKVFGLFPKAIDNLLNVNFSPKKQPSQRTTRYVMHPFLKNFLETKILSFKS